MSYPNEILLPTDAKHFGFVKNNYDYNPEYDITWSFTYTLSGQEHGLGTFLTNQTIISGIPGHYMGYLGTLPLSAYMTSEDGIYILSEDGKRIYSEDEDGVDYNGSLIAVFDSSGYFGLSSYNRDGVSLADVKKNVLCIRNGMNSLVLYKELSTMDDSFKLAENDGSSYKTLRFRYANAGNKLSIDWRNDDTSKFTLLTSLEVNLYTKNYDDINIGFTYCSPMSSNTVITSVLKLENFHVQGVSKVINNEHTKFVPLTSVEYNTYSTVSAL